MLNWIWLGMLLIAVLAAGIHQRMTGLVEGAIKGAENSVTLALGLVGIMALWLGLMRLAERAGLVMRLARLLRPLLRWLFPDVPAGHPAMGSMVLNIAANVLGLTNAATPLGLRAMRDLESLNPRPGIATNAMCTFLAINTGSVQLIPVSAIAVLAAHGSSNPTAIVGTTLLATTCSSVAALAVAKIAERLPGFRLQPAEMALESDVESAPADPPLTTAPVPFPWWGWPVMLLLVGVFGWFAMTIAWPGLVGGALTPDQARQPDLIRAAQALSIVAIPFLLVAFPVYAALCRVPVYEEFVEGAREGFQTAVRMMPFLVAMLVAIGALRGAGVIEVLTQLLRPMLDRLGFPAELMPLALLRPLTGSGSLAAFTDLVKTQGADSLVARMGGTLFGSTETTFYVLAVYFGAVGIRRTRHALLAGLSADVVGAFAAVFVCRALLG
jgi:spore maturation protein SpmA